MEGSVPPLSINELSVIGSTTVSKTVSTGSNPVARDLYKGRCVMSYRVKKKCTKTTEDYCLKCKHCEVITEKKVRCKADNSCFISEFDPKDWYCQEYRSLNEISDYEKQKMIDKYNKKIAKAEIRKFANSYYCKKDRKQIIEGLMERL